MPDLTSIFRLFYSYFWLMYSSKCSTFTRYLLPLFIYGISFCFTIFLIAYNVTSVFGSILFNSTNAPL